MHHPSKHKNSATTKFSLHRIKIVAIDKNKSSRLLQAFH